MNFQLQLTELVAREQKRLEASIHMFNHVIVLGNKVNEKVGVQCLPEGYFPQSTRLLMDVLEAARIEHVTFQLQLR